MVRLNSIDTRVNDGHYGVSLRQIEGRLGSDVVRIEYAADAPDPNVRALDIYDAASSEASGEVGAEGMLLCLVSADAMRPEELERALAAAANNSCAGVAIKVAAGSERESELIAQISRMQLATVILSPEVSWREFDALITGTLGENAQSLNLAPSAGDKLFALANTIARTFGGSVAIEDHQRSILAHSSVTGQAIDDLRTTGILFRRAGDAPVNEARYREVLEAEGPIRFPRYGDYLPRAAIAVRAGTIPLGSIWVLDPDGDATGDTDGTQLSTEKAEVLERAAAMAAGTLLEAWKASSRSGSRRESALRRVLIAAAQQGDREELDPTGDAVGVILAATVAAGPRSAGRIAEARAVFARHLAMYVPNVVISAEANEIIALCPTPLVEQVREWALSALADLSDDTSAGIQVGVSDAHSISNRLPFAANEARDVARHSRSTGEPVGTVTRVRTQLFLAACRSQLELDDRLLLPEVRELLESGESKHQLVDTLECWLSEVGNVARTAERLLVHEQTVRYRLKRLRELFPLEGAEPDYLVTLWAQLRAMRDRT
ncbi:PucR family transcriptional regulator [Leucobacter denitrificans]|uniref:Helix-turn-helix domain-containing protein n=1 Tax=Leucobacter denitrificans TaxID=683042 RepID=A0A7G9S7F4_9MICO|nr:PucR family transcriptional regulator [Leucobacter denitrificans]QNN63779.1 helix-turn-helix domain-containing protein [Leucobacter denitrificans]